jgi:hypothetical protein
MILPHMVPTGIPKIIVTLVVLISVSRSAVEPTRAAENLEERFLHPADVDKPWAYWWWINGNVDRPTITHDLEQMKEKGFGGLLLFDARGYHDDHCPPPPPRTRFMSPEWRELVRFAMSEAGRVGLEMSINLSSCAGALKGPWPVMDDAPKQLVWTSAQVTGPGELAVQLRPSGDAYFRDVAVLAFPSEQQAGTRKGDIVSELSQNWQKIQTKSDATMTVERVLDLTASIDSDGRLAWKIPAGNWTIIRFARTAMAGHEYDVDVLDRNAVAGHFDRMGKRLIADAGPAAGKTLTHFYSVSWEGAAPTWTSGFEQQFQKYRGYALRPWLPVLTGKFVQSPEVSARFLRDYYKTLGDLFRDNFYGQLHASCRAHGIKWHSESGGPWNRKLAAFQNANQLAFLARNDMPQGEFWYRGRAMNRQPAMAAHVYGKRLAATEAFTHMRTHWSAYPAMLKRDADLAFVDGVNHFIWHTYSCSPPEFGKPGIEYFAGTHVNPNVTWFHQARGIVDYLARCQVMLRQGLYVADVCCYTGDKAYMHWGRGEKWSTNASLTLGKGYNYDLVNDEVLLNRMTVQDGRLVLPDGMSYRTLVVDLVDEAVAPETLNKIAELARAGATVVLGARRPTRAPGLQGYPTCDADVKQLADQLWDERGEKGFGKGQVFVGRSVDEVLAAQSILPDFEGEFEAVHRRVGQMDIFFIAGEGADECRFRVSGKRPELWCPKSGEIRDVVCYRRADDGRMVVPLRLPANGSTFVVFRKPLESQHVVSLPSPRVQIVSRTGDRLRLRCWDNATHVLETALAGSVTVEPEQRPASREVSGPWNVAFSPEWGGPESIVFDRLIPWNEHSDDGIKYYSGTATYSKALNLTSQQVDGLVRLCLGKVGHVAEVRLNGDLLDVVWCDPWTVDLTGAVREGDNQLTISVANLWVNRMIGDSGLPAEQRRTSSNVRLFDAEAKYRPFEGFSRRDELVPSGLIGPVTLEFGSEVEVPL